MSNIKQTETKFEVYEDETDVKLHEMPEVDDIPDLDLFLYIELCFHRMEVICKQPSLLVEVLIIMGNLLIH